MDADNKLDQLKRRASMESLGPVGVLSNRAALSVAAAISSVVTQLRQFAYDQPLITLLLSFQAGYLVARVGRRHARH